MAGPELGRAQHNPKSQHAGSEGELSITISRSPFPPSQEWQGKVRFL